MTMYMPRRGLRLGQRRHRGHAGLHDFAIPSFFMSDDPVVATGSATGTTTPAPAPSTSTNVVPATATTSTPTEPVTATATPTTQVTVVTPTTADTQPAAAPLPTIGAPAPAPATCGPGYSMNWNNTACVTTPGPNTLDPSICAPGMVLQNDHCISTTDPSYVPMVAQTTTVSTTDAALAIPAPTTPALTPVTSTVTPTATLTMPTAAPAPVAPLGPVNAGYDALQLQQMQALIQAQVSAIQHPAQITQPAKPQIRRSQRRAAPTSGYPQAIPTKTILMVGGGFLAAVLLMKLLK